MAAKQCRDGVPIERTLKTRAAVGHTTTEHGRQRGSVENCRGREKLQTRAAAGELSEAEVLCIFFFDMGVAFTAQIDVQPHPPFVCFLLTQNSA
jgi:hypothetical protein